MKTDRFDEEFRRKLLGLPANTDPGEVGRIQAYVRANKPVLPGSGWGKLLLYAGGGLLLIGSLSYNLIQNYRNTHLQSSLDSLTHQSLVPAVPEPVVRYDTVYITRARDKEMVGVASGPASRSHLSTGNLNDPTTSESPVLPNLRGAQSEQLHTESEGSMASSPKASTGHSISEKANPTNGVEPVAEPSRNELGAIGETSVTNRLSPARRSGNSRRNLSQPTASREDRNGQLTATHADKKRHPVGYEQSIAKSRSITTDSSSSDGVVAEQSRQPIAVEPLTSRIAIQKANPLVMIVPSRPLVIPKNELAARATRRSWHLTLPTLAVSNAQYRIGAGLMAGNHEQVGGSLFGEVMLNRHWSVQAGLRLLYDQRFHYRNDHEFEEHEGEDFRQNYASQVPLSSDIQDIEKRSLLVQVPIQMAYHYPLSRQWELRLGVGTDLDLWIRNVISYEYRENSRSSLHGLSLSDEPIHMLNNLTLSTMIERSGKKWLFRAGPYLSPQLRPVAYKPDDLSWGANLQVLYRLGK